MKQQGAHRELVAVAGIYISIYFIVEVHLKVMLLVCLAITIFFSIVLIKYW